MSRPPSREGCQFLPVVLIVNNTQLNCLTKLIVEVVESFFVFLKCCLLCFLPLFLYFLSRQ